MKKNTMHAIYASKCFFFLDNNQNTTSNLTEQKEKINLIKPNNYDENDDRVQKATESYRKLPVYLNFRESQERKSL